MTASWEVSTLAKLNTWLEAAETKFGDRIDSYPGYKQARPAINGAPTVTASAASVVPEHARIQPSPPPIRSVARRHRRPGALIAASKREADARERLLSRLLDTTLTLDEAALVLGVCTATVRRYANHGRFRLREKRNAH